MGAAVKVLKKVPSRLAQKAAEVVRVLQKEERIHVTPEGIKVIAPSQNMNFMDKAKNAVGKKLSKVAKRSREGVASMNKAFKTTKFGKKIKPYLRKTKFVDIKTDSQIFKVTKKIPEYGLKEG